MFAINSLHQNSPSDNTCLNEIRAEIKAEKFGNAYEILRRHPMLQLSTTDIKDFLNNLDSIASSQVGSVSSSSNGKSLDEIQMKLDISTILYRRFQRQCLLRGFGCVDRAYPENSVDISPLALEEKSGLSLSSFTPKRRTTYWRVAGAALLLSEYLVGAQLGIDPIYTIIPATMFIFGKLFLCMSHHPLSSSHSSSHSSSRPSSSHSSRG